MRMFLSVAMTTRPAADYVEARIRLHRDYDGVIGTKNVYPDLPYSRIVR